MFRVLTGDVEVGEGTAVAVGAGEADLGGVGEGHAGRSMKCSARQPK